MKETKSCYRCHRPGDVAYFAWNGNGYAGYCEDCFDLYESCYDVGEQVRQRCESEYARRLITLCKPACFEDAKSANKMGLSLCERCGRHGKLAGAIYSGVWGIGYDSDEEDDDPDGGWYMGYCPDCLTQCMNSVRVGMTIFRDNG